MVSENNNIIKLLIRVSVLLILILVTVFVFSKFDNRLKNETNPNILRIHNSIGYDSLDYLFIGSSYTYSSINTYYFDSAGIKTYNLGVATAGPYFYEIIINDYLKKSKCKPKCIVMDLSLLTCSDKSDNWISYPVHRYLNYPVSNEYITQKFSVYKDYLSIMQKSFSKGIANFFYSDFLFNFFDDEINTLSEEYIRINDFKGFEKISDTLDENIITKENHIFNKFNNAEFNHNKADKLLNLINSIVKDNINVCIIQIPTNYLYTYFPENYINEFDKLCQQIRNNKNVTFIVPDSTLKLSEKNYRNADHMNFSGANIYTRFLFDKLKFNKNEKY